jgi:MoxR-like ATPase
VTHALYDWNYARQMLYIRTLEAAQAATPGAVADVFGSDFLVRRPLLEAIDNHDTIPPVLLIDEIDRADDEFEAFLLELLSDFQVTIPEIGTIRAHQRPVIVLTSNRTRELHDALKRRCLYHWIGYPTLEREIEIVHARLPGVSERLVAEAAAFVAGLREAELSKRPGLAETVDWVEALFSLNEVALDTDVVDATLGAVLKTHEDIRYVRGGDLADRVERARALVPVRAPADEL